MGVNRFGHGLTGCSGAARLHVPSAAAAMLCSYRSSAEAGRVCFTRVQYLDLLIL